MVSLTTIRRSAENLSYYFDRYNDLYKIRNIWENGDDAVTDPVEKVELAFITENADLLYGRFKRLTNILIRRKEKMSNLECGKLYHLLMDVASSKFLIDEQKGYIELTDNLRRYRTDTPEHVVRSDIPGNVKELTEKLYF